MSLYCQYCERLVKEFYGSIMIVDDESHFCVAVNNKKLIADIEKTAKVFDLPNHGNVIGSFKDVNALPIFNEEYFLKKLTQIHTKKKDLNNALLLNPIHRILHFFIIHHLNPRTLSLTYVNKLDTCILWHLIEKFKFNLPFLIFKSMFKGSTIRRLPYALQLTMFCSYHNIPLSFGSKTIIEIKETFVGPPKKTSVL